MMAALTAMIASGNAPITAATPMRKRPTRDDEAREYNRRADNKEAQEAAEAKRLRKQQKRLRDMAHNACDKPTAE